MNVVAVLTALWSASHQPLSALHHDVAELERNTSSLERERAWRLRCFDINALKENVAWDDPKVPADFKGLWLLYGNHGGEAAVSFANSGFRKISEAERSGPGSKFPSWAHYTVTKDLWDETWTWPPGPKGTGPLVMGFSQFQFTKNVGFRYEFVFNEALDYGEVFGHFFNGNVRPVGVFGEGSEEEKVGWKMLDMMTLNFTMVKKSEGLWIRQSHWNGVHGERRGSAPVWPPAIFSGYAKKLYVDANGLVAECEASIFSDCSKTGPYYKSAQHLPKGKYTIRNAKTLFGNAGEKLFIDLSEHDTTALSNIVEVENLPKPRLQDVYDDNKGRVGPQQDVKCGSWFGSCGQHWYSESDYLFVDTVFVNEKGQVGVTKDNGPWYTVDATMVDAADAGGDTLSTILSIERRVQLLEKAPKTLLDHDVSSFCDMCCVKKQRSYESFQDGKSKSRDCASYDSFTFGWYHAATEEQCMEHCSGEDTATPHMKAPALAPLALSTPPPVRMVEDSTQLPEGIYKITNMNEITGRLNEPIEIAVGNDKWTFGNPRTGNALEDYYVMQIMDKDGNKLPAWDENYIKLHQAKGDDQTCVGEQYSGGWFGNGAVVYR